MERSSEQSIFEESFLTIRFGEKDATISDIDEGTATVTISAPALRAARAARVGAPQHGPPPITRILPAFPLCPSGIPLIQHCQVSRANVLFWHPHRFRFQQLLSFLYIFLHYHLTSPIFIR